MFRAYRKYKNKKYTGHGIDPDEIFLDSANLPNFDTDQMEGRIEKPIAKKTLGILYFSFLLVFSGLLYKIFMLQVVNGEQNYHMSENNRLRQNVLFATRGNIYDRNDEPLVWNTPEAEGEDFAQRKYSEKEGISSLLGFIRYPKKDSSGFYYEVNFSGIEGVESQFNDVLAGINGYQIIETNALNEIVSGNTVKNPEPGESVTLSIDVEIQEKLYQSIKQIAEQVNFQGGGGVIMDVKTGEIVALTSYPEYDSQRIVDGDAEYIKEINADSQNPFLNRVTQGLYTPGSIVKPYVALGALNEGVIDQYTNIISRGELEIPNPYDPSNPTFFSDWKAHGAVDVRKALAVSSNIYFYVVGGGFQDITGLGITRLEKYMRSFGFGSKIEGQVASDLTGTIPNPEWKAEHFDGDIWRLGDTYFTAIGQYGFQATPLQAVRAMAAVANKGTLLNPTIIKGQEPDIEHIVDNISPEIYQIVHEGMRMGVMEGTAKGLSIPGFEIAAKTGTAELGVSKDNVNSWTTGFFPYENPRYAFVVVMEKGSRTNLIGGVAVARTLFDWMVIHKPEYIQ